jgi:hypothetical protein
MASSLVAAKMHVSREEAVKPDDDPGWLVTGELGSHNGEESKPIRIAPARL